MCLFVYLSWYQYFFWQSVPNGPYHRRRSRQVNPDLFAG